jgi:hypothetical protein
MFTNGNEDLGDLILYNDIIEEYGKYYGLYNKSEKAIIEVMYYKLCKELDLPNVYSEYVLRDGILTSKSELPKERKTYTGWGKKVKNTEDWYAHYILHLMLQRYYLDVDMGGFIKEDGAFIKANNGWSFLFLLLQRYIRAEYVPILYKTTTREILEIIEEYPSSYFVIERLSNLSIKQLKSCLEMPDWEYKEKSIEFLLPLLKDIRQLAKKVKKQKEGG